MRYRQVLKHPIIGKLTLIQFISYFGSWFSQVAIFAMIATMGADATTISFVAVVAMLPAIVFAPFFGSIIDRVPFKKLMLFLLVVEIVAVVGFTFVNSLHYIWVLMVLIFVRSASTSLLFSAQMSLLPKLLNGSMLKSANEIQAIVWSVTYALGMALGGIVAHHISFDGAFLADAILYSVALSIALGLQFPKLQTTQGQSSTALIKEGITYLKNNKKLLHLIVLHGSLGLTSFDALITLLAQTQYATTIAIALGIGYMNALRAVGLMVGPFLLSKLTNKHTLTYLFSAQGLAILFWAFVQDSFYLSLLAHFFVGLFATSLWSYTYLLLQEGTDESFLGRVIAYNDMFFMVCNSIVALFIGYAFTLGVSLHTITIVLGIGFLLTAVYYKWFLNYYG